MPCGRPRSARGLHSFHCQSPQPQHFHPVAGTGTAGPAGIRCQVHCRSRRGSEWHGAPRSQRPLQGSGRVAICPPSPHRVALRMAVSVRGLGQRLDGNRLRECPSHRQIYRHLPPDSVGLGWTALDTKKAGKPLNQVFPALVAPSRTGMWWSQGGSNS